MVGRSAFCFFRTAGLVVLVYQTRLAAFSVGLKGGACNFDPLLRWARFLCGVVCWSCGRPLAKFSPRQEDFCARESALAQEALMARIRLALGPSDERGGAVAALCTYGVWLETLVPRPLQSRKRSIATARITSVFLEWGCGLRLCSGSSEKVILPLL